MTNNTQIRRRAPVTDVRACTTPLCSTAHTGAGEACTFGALDIPRPGVVAGLITFRVWPDGARDVVVDRHDESSGWAGPQPVAACVVSQLEAAHNPPSAYLTPTPC
jgi:hypothetical protein